MSFVLLLLHFKYALADTINVLTTTSDLKSITEYIGGDKVKVESLGDGRRNYHFLEAKPSYMIKAKKANLFIVIGRDLEIGYEPLILGGSRNPDIQRGKIGYLDASTGIKALEVPEIVDRSMGDVHPSGNPHYWLDPLNTKIIASNIAGALSRIAKENSSYFEANLENFNGMIDRKMEEWSGKMEIVKDENIATYHKNWIYFAKRFGLNIVCELEPKPGVPPSPGHLKEVVDIIKGEHAKIILNEIYFPRTAADFVSKETGAKVLIVPNSVGGSAGSGDYFSLIDIIVDNISGAYKNAKDN